MRTITSNIIINLHCTCQTVLSTAKFHRYFKTVREREMRIKGGKNEQHKEKCKKNRRLLTVSFKTNIALQYNLRKKNFCMKRSFPKLQNNSLPLDGGLCHKYMGVKKLMEAVHAIVDVYNVASNCFFWHFISSHS